MPSRTLQRKLFANAQAGHLFGGRKPLPAICSGLLIRTRALQIFMRNSRFCHLT